MRICIPIAAPDTETALEKIARANEMADLLEFRLDRLDGSRLDLLMGASARPVIATYRSLRQGGEGSDNFAVQSQNLIRGLESGARLVDAEFGLPKRFLEGLLVQAGSGRVIVSHHQAAGTPSWTSLKKQLGEMGAVGASTVKIVTYAQAVEDNLRVLRLIHEGRMKGLEVVAFCMGPLGLLSRLASPLLGGYLTFASLERGEESAPGQIPAREMRRLLTFFRSGSWEGREGLPDD